MLDATTILLLYMVMLPSPYSLLKLRSHEHTQKMDRHHDSLSLHIYNRLVTATDPKQRRRRTS
uniref:Uncharacterized protein n=1 Tax=Arundo donax TaxID=35708 RepID=A0A0A8XXT8_ARUDO